MRLKAPDRMDVIKKEDKEARLVQFIARDLEARKAAPSPTARNEYLLVLRSAESPVARALTTLAADIAASGLSVRTVIVQVSAESIDRDVKLAKAFAAGIRIVRDIRLLDAHEQLVVNNAAAWIGDCMRREPAKRDAFEQYAEDRAETARWAEVSFERLWSMAEDIVAAPTVVAAAVAETHDVPDGMPVPEEAQAGPEVATRH